MTMKKRICLFLAAALLAACTRSAEGELPLPGELTVTAKIATRNPDITEAFGDGEAMSVLLAGGAEDGAEHLRFVARKGRWHGDPARLLEEGESATLYALCPYRAGLEDPRAIPLHVAEQTDWLCSERGVAVDRAHASAQVSMEHLQAVLAFNVLRADDYAGEGLAEELRLEGAFPLEATYDATTRRQTVVERGGYAIPCTQRVVDGGWRRELPSLLSLPFLPSSSSEVRVVLRVDGREYASSLPSMYYAPGRRYLFHLALSDGRLTLLSDRTQTTPIGETADDPAALDRGLLRVVHEGFFFGVPRIAGGSPGTIFWGDGQEEPYVPYTMHQYGATEAHTVGVESWDADRAEFDGLTGVVSIDFSRF